MRRARVVGVALSVVAIGCDVGDASLDDLEPPTSVIAIRPDTPGNRLMFNFDAGETVETFDSIPSQGASGHFRVHFTRDGLDAVPPADADMSGVPDFVELVAATYEEVFDHDVTFGFSQPVPDLGVADNGGDGKFDVYLVDFAGQGDGHYISENCTKATCTGFMTQENDFKGYGYPSLEVAVRTVSSHEYFHAIQASYDAQQGSVLAEGTATWATEHFDPSLKDFESQIAGYMSDTGRPLDEPPGGAVDSFSYGTAIFFQFLEEGIQPGLIRSLLDHTKDNAGGVADPQWFQILDKLLVDDASTSFGDAFVKFATWNLFTSQRADPTQGYANGAQYNAPKMESVAAPYSDGALRVYHASTQYFKVPVDGRASMSAALVSKAMGDTDGLVLLAGVDKDSKYTVTKLADLGGATTVDTTGADALVVAIVNTNMSGESKRPAFCVGTADEIATCKTGTPMTSGAGGGGSGGGGGGGADGDSGGGCSCSVHDAPPSALGPVVALLGYAALRRRRLRAPRRTR